MDLLVNVDVDDLARAVAFYTQAFGLRVGRRFGGAAAELLGATSPIYLLENRGGSAPYPGAATPRDYGRHWTPVHLDVAVPALEPALARAEAAGARREGELVERPWGRMARLADPFGHGICLLEFRGRGYDEIADPA
ncbi:VOC family protein [Anaeromyxobacter sp. PSR-1]|uniref:VOC family protein n=1 Tax=unclassified Anaeromyxobacter TaxID=2620896 RepID=UPI0005E3D35F|nr:VOC family protein [Anaeromyxobacter sp. PSR-1]GAO03688.1 glyoxalase-like domain protein [Anaeromyxobacter sp. PSR-1]